jgi:4-diphosphocytidyl-2-C-methyl-D-erythritol kinase
MLSFPNCKINLGLKVLPRREDGFHDLETVFYPLPVRDVLETVRAEALRFSPMGRAIPGDPTQNLCVKAFELLKKDFPELPFVHIHLYKHIPIGAGLGGGSSDGAFLLRLLNDQFQLGLNREQLLGYALQLGSDCPFFVLDGPCLGSGRGERLESLALDLSQYSFLILHPRIHVSTARAFSLLAPRDSTRTSDGVPSLRELIAQPVADWAGKLVNEFEQPVFGEYPILALLKDQLYRRGALYASLAGSGSSLFGIFEKDRADTRGWDPACEVILVK